MSSAVAMNRRVARQTNDTLQEFDRQTDQNRQQRPIQAKGTPVQQCWTVLNFHETRLKNIEDQVHRLTATIKNSDGTENASSEVRLLLQRMDRLEKENAIFRQALQSNTKSGKKSMSLEVSEN